MIIEYRGKRPLIAESVFIAPTAVVIGDVEIGEGASVWFGAVLRGDHGKIVVGPGTSIQENAVIHVEEDGQTIIGPEVTIGHCAVLEAVTIGRGAVIGMNATLVHGAAIGEEAVVAAGSVVTGVIPPRTMAAGVPAQVKKTLDGDALKWATVSAPTYRHLAQTFMFLNDRRLVAYSSEQGVGAADG
ncbi:MAG TPA: gamma carbonic anhydrase family protein [Chloroflexi bacterium]|nr:gamma carbonic anhydrase family protein [Chloroflexota bacterium]